MTPVPSLLRDLVAEIPVHLRQEWYSFIDQIYVQHNGNDHVFAWTDTNGTTSRAGNAEVAACITAFGPLASGAYVRLPDP